MSGLYTNPNDDNQGEIIIYQSESGDTKIDARFVDETVWLTQQQMAELFQSSRTNIVEHIQHIYDEGELDEESTCRKFRQVRMEGNRQVTRELPFYNLDMIISVELQEEMRSRKVGSWKAGSTGPSWETSCSSGLAKVFELASPGSGLCEPQFSPLEIFKLWKVTQEL